MNKSSCEESFNSMFSTYTDFVSFLRNVIGEKATNGMTREDLIAEIETYNEEINGNSGVGF